MRTRGPTGQHLDHRGPDDRGGRGEQHFDPGEPGTSSTGPDIPMCGNGVPELGEQCDDGNALEGDGCNPDCRPSGTQLFSFTSGLDGPDQAETVMLTADGDLIVGGITGDNPDRDGFVARYRPDGVEVWRHILQGDADRVDAVWAVAPSPSGNVRALGQIINDPGGKKKVTPREDYWLSEFDVENGITQWSFVEGGGPPATERGYAMVVLPDGDMVVAGRVGSPSNSDFGVVRFSVAETGKKQFELSTVWEQAFDGGLGLRDFAEAVAYDETGRLVVGGTMEYEEADLDRHLRVLDVDGEGLEPPCEDLGGDDDLAADDRIFAVAVGPSGEVVAAGRATRETEEGTDAWLGYYPPGSCKLQWVETEPGPGQDADAFTTVAIDELGNIVAGGYLNLGNTEDAWLAKYDPTGEQLWAIEPIDGTGNGADRIEAVVIGPGREITVAGRLTRPGDDDFWIARYTP